ncbi:uncharacterized protein LOC128986600 isoform X2 [Macrosteles quadrilineatus]|nr:uncharacterized protein LOC128986600 isoform X2 [Macrosteles quadrilineatus]
MTMDIHQRGLRHDGDPLYLPRVSPETIGSQTPDIPSPPQKPAKRSFDVAFLMAPDDLSTKKRQQQQQQLRLVTSASLMQRHSPPHMTMAGDMEMKISRHLHHQRMMHQRDFNDLRPTSPLGLLIPSPKEVLKSGPDSKESVIDVTQEEENQFAKSAFTKVKSARLDFPGANVSASPSSVTSNRSGGLSPDVSYQDSLSPPMANRGSPVNYAKMNPNMNYFEKNPPNVQFYPKEKPEGNSSREGNGFVGNLLNKPPDMGKFRTMFCPNGNLPYGGLPVPYPFPPNFPPGGPPVPALLTAAASVTAALLPPALAALTLPAQNVCAKCKISFRMTSDLVYHMRSHHKGEHVAVDAVRRRREQDKLRCPVCNETFRERHHLTRHMTAHQDKEGDDDEDDALELSRRRNHLK